MAVFINIYASGWWYHQATLPPERVELDFKNITFLGSEEMEDPYILIYEKKLSGLQELLPLLESVVQTSKPQRLLVGRPPAADAKNPAPGGKALGVRQHVPGLAQRRLQSHL